MIEIEYTTHKPTFEKKRFRTSSEAMKFIYELKKQDYMKHHEKKEVEKVYFIHYLNKEGKLII